MSLQSLKYLQISGHFQGQAKLSGACEFRANKQSYFPKLVAKIHTIVLNECVRFYFYLFFFFAILRFHLYDDSEKM